MLKPEGREGGAKTIKHLLPSPMVRQQGQTAEVKKTSLALTDSPQLQRSDGWDGNYESRGPILSIRSTRLIALFG